MRSISTDSDGIDQAHLGVAFPATQAQLHFRAQSRRMLGELLFRRITVEPKYSYFRRTLERFRHRNTVVDEFDSYKTVREAGETIDRKLRRRMLAGIVDAHYDAIRARNEARLGRVPGSSLRAVELAWDLLRLDREITRRDLAVDPSRYHPSHVLTLGVGAEWDSPAGNSIADITLIKGFIEDAFPGVTDEDFEVILATQSFRAAQQDPSLRAAIQEGRSKTPTEQDMRDNWGVGQITKGNAGLAQGDIDPDGELVRVWPDIAIVRLRPDRFPQEDTETAVIDSFVEPIFGDRQNPDPEDLGLTIEPVVSERNLLLSPVVGWDDAVMPSQLTCGIIFNTVSGS